MPERESASPQHDPDARLGDLFENLPDPSQQIPTVDNTPPAPGSRRAAREAAAVQSSSGPAGEPADTSPSEDATTRAMPTAAAGDAADPRPASSTPSAEAGPSSDRVSGSTSAESAAAGASAPAVAGSAAGGRLEDLFQGHPEEHSSNRPPVKKKRRTGCLVALVIVLAVIGGIVGAGVWAWNAYGDRISNALGWGEPEDWEPGLATGEVLVTISEGDTGGPVSTALYEAGVTRSEDVFYDYLVSENIAVTFYPGIYSLQEKMTAEAALEALQNPENKRENSASVGEGATIESSLPGMAESLGMPIEELQAAVDADPATYGVTAQNLEGWLFPAVYTFDPGVTATQVIQRMVDRTRESLTEAGVPAEDAQRVLTIASIIQREGLTADFPKVSRVIENRLDIDMKLQMDSTAQYGYGSLHEGVVSSSAEALEDDNLWNTYVHTGLPVTPIASPSYAAIDAAMHPADGPWLYFVTTNLATGETQFSVTYEEHLQGVEKWEQWCQENPDGGCSAG
ncbi:endolytic transglycosylase MltG [Microbacterium sp. APC 3901]|uniref:endolytic transglycosylase MltG n=1 Tax=Microbacterium sp. APC 3901 TaxID=3035192 RepID=UPI0025B2DB88|nr:endolytic transglycosylase MltG [Microbacterium sp. APC 3901]MDN3443943.1 endolytic transglycosylase MltG [Microbacterium sp. APC 3901]